MSDSETKASLNFIEQIIEADNASGKWGGRVHTRFPPEPNGYLHIGHAKSICLNFGVAQKYGGACNLRFDDTNPMREDVEYVKSIATDIRWLGFEWPNIGNAEPEDGALFASTYFEQMYQFAIELIKKGKAFVCDLTALEMREYRGTLKAPGKDSPHRQRSIEENLKLFERMRKGEFHDGSKSLRAKIDMASPNLNLRDPVMYRIVFADHHRVGNSWCIFPTYDWAHGLEDSLEGITHSLCTLEFENHRPLYDWFIDAINEGRTDDGSGEWGKKIVHSQQIEFARLKINYTVLSKRKLLELVRDKHVSGWDDPRMPTISGLRRGGYTPESIRDFCADVGVAKFVSTIDVGRLENAVRADLNKTALRRMAVLNPLKVTITNWPDELDIDGAEQAKEPGAGAVDWTEAVNNPEDEAAGMRKVPFGKTLYIEREDFMEDPPKKFFRLGPDREVRLRYGYFITCNEVIKNDAGEVVELLCTYDPATRGGDSPDGRKVKGTLHWVSAAHAVNAEVRVYDRLFMDPDPDSAKHEKDFKEFLNPDSLKVLTDCRLEPALAEAKVGDRIQFERHGYFCVDYDAEKEGRLIFNRTVGLRDSWAKQKGK